MAYYLKEERETVIVFDEMSKQWKVWSTVPRHIERLIQAAEIRKALTDDDGTVILVDGYLAPSQVRFYDVPSDKQKEHMAKMRARRLND